MDTSVCIVTFNASQRLRDCLHSLREFPPGGEFELIVVDNASTDDTCAMLAKEFPQVKLIYNATNAGFTKPINQALEQASGDWLLLLNPDTLLTQALVQPLQAFMSADATIGIASPKVLNANGSFQLQSRRGEARPMEVFGYFLHLDRIFPNNRKLAGYLMRWLPENEPSEVKAVSGSCMLIKRAVLGQVGMFDEQFFAYQEDSDYCFRARQAGWKVFYAPVTSIVHLGGEGGSRVYPYQGVWHWHRSYFLYYCKHLARDYFFLVNWAFYGMMALKLAWAMVITFFRKKKVVGTPKP